jgi:hypothetical protein
MSINVIRLIAAEGQHVFTVRATFNGRNGAGPISVPGLKVGDLVIWLLDTLDGGLKTGDSFLESVVSVDDQIQQIATNDFTVLPWDALLMRGV